MGTQVPVREPWRSARGLSSSARRIVLSLFPTAAPSAAAGVFVLEVPWGGWEAGGGRGRSDRLPPRRSLIFFAGGRAPSFPHSRTSPSSSGRVGADGGAFCGSCGPSWSLGGLWVVVFPWGAAEEAVAKSWKKRVSGGVCLEAWVAPHLSTSPP